MPANPAQVAAKLKAVRVSPKFTAILGAMLGEDWTSPRLVELCATSDGFFLGREAGDCGFNAFLGELSDLRRNCEGVAAVAGLTKAETRYLLSRIPV